MKFLPVLRPLVLVATVLTLDACDTPANRRELYNNTEPNGVWHDYARRREAEVAVGLPPGSTKTAPGVSTSVRTDRQTPQPSSGPIQADATALPSANTTAPSSTTTTTVSPAAAPNPVMPGESAPTTTPGEPGVPPPPAAPPQ